MSFGRLRLRGDATIVSCAVLLVVLTVFLSLPVLLLFGSVTSLIIVLAVHLWAVVVAMLQLRSAIYFSRLLSLTLVDEVIDRIRSIENIDDLAMWLRKTYDKRRQFVFCLAVSLLLTTVCFAVIPIAQPILLNPGTFVLSLVCWFLGATGWYFLIPAVTLSSRLARYDLELFELDPAQSNLISSICAMMHSALFLSALVATVFTAGIFLIGDASVPTQIVFTVVCAWGPLVFTMIYYQYSLFLLIKRAKRKTLAPIQDMLKLSHLNVESIDTLQLEKMNKMLDLHKRISATNSTALDWKGSFTTINTLLIPLMSFLIAHTKELYK
jgi:hypothetical protein